MVLKRPAQWELKAWGWGVDWVDQCAACASRQGQSWHGTKDSIVELTNANIYGCQDAGRATVSGKSRENVGISCKSIRGEKGSQYST